MGLAVDTFGPRTHQIKGFIGTEPQLRSPEFGGLTSAIAVGELDAMP